MQNSIKFFCAWLSACATLQATSLVEVITILSRYVQNPSQVGEIAPLSESAARELARTVGQEESISAKRYLEAGGGLGAVSVEIAKNLRPQDSLTVIEIDKTMCEILKKRLSEYPNVTVQCCSILDWHPGHTYDGIISTLPFNSLGIEFTMQAIDYFKNMAAADCIFAYVEYPIVKQAIQYLYTGDRKKNFKAVQKFLEKIREEYLISKTVVYFNVPPIAIYHLCFN